MDQAITVGEVVGFVLIGGGAVLVLGVLIWILSVYASGFNH